MTLHAAASCDKGQVCRWYWEYWRADEPRSTSTKTAVQGPVSGPVSSKKLSTRITGLFVRATYRWVFCASPNNGATYECAGPRGEFGPTTADPPPDYAEFTTPPVRTLAEAWDGSDWQVQASPNDMRNFDNRLVSISCTSPAACTAVGQGVNATGPESLVQRWDGHSWTPQSLDFSGANGVSCSSGSACTAVGSTVETGFGFVDRWDGTRWSTQLNPTPATGSLDAVSCPSDRSCTAVGSSQQQKPFAMAWDGTTWTLQPTPEPPGNAVLTGVSCSSSNACVAVGTNTDPSGAKLALSERWNGATWSIEPTPTVPGDAELSSVSCTPSGTCMAVGSYLDAGGTKLTLAERWDGASWSVAPTRNRRRASSSELSGVSCTSATACTAVGSDVNDAGNPVTLAERWNGAAWSIEPTPNPLGQPALDSVSCTSNADCAAVGSY